MKPKSIKLQREELAILLYLAHLADEACNKDIAEQGRFGERFVRAHYTQFIFDRLLECIAQAYPGGFDLVDYLREGAQLLAQDFKGAGQLKVVWQRLTTQSKMDEQC